jgi:heat shock protein HslJ
VSLILRVIAASLCAAIAPALAAQSASALPLQEWRLTWMSSGPLQQRADLPLPWIGIDVAKRQVVIDAGCNRFSASFNNANHGFVFGPSISTEMYCDERMDNELAVQALLPKVRKATIENASQRWLDQHGRLLAELERIALPIAQARSIPRKGAGWTLNQTRWRCETGGAIEVAALDVGQTRFALLRRENTLHWLQLTDATYAAPGPAPALRWDPALRELSAGDTQLASGCLER